MKHLYTFNDDEKTVEGDAGKVQESLPKTISL